ncbi:MAG: hypothetical protein V3U75_07925 [Methylococcaceae bacterium]
MKKQIALILLLCSMMAAAGSINHRSKIVLDDQGTNMILTEMRKMLSGTKDIILALAENDMAKVSKAAGQMGKHMTHQVERSKIMGSLPSEFRKLGMSVHADFDKISTDAATHGESASILKQLGTAMNKCVACHEGYRLVKAPE